VLRLFNAWTPDFLIDNHVTDGSDFQYDVTWDMARNQDLGNSGAWVREKFIPSLTGAWPRTATWWRLRQLAFHGAQGAPRREFFMEVFSPRYSHLYAAAQNRPRCWWRRTA